MAFACYTKGTFCHIISEGVIPVLSVTSLICNIITLWILSRIKFPFSQHLPLQWLVVCHIMCSLTNFAAQMFGFEGILMHNAFLTLGSFMIVTLLIGGWCQLNIPTQIQFWNSPKIQNCWFIACVLFVILPAIVLANYTNYRYSKGNWVLIYSDMYASTQIIWYCNKILPNALIVFFVLWFAYEASKDHLKIIRLLQALGVIHVLASIPYSFQRFSYNINDLLYEFQIVTELLYLHLTFAFLCYFNKGFRNYLLNFVCQKRSKLRDNQCQMQSTHRRCSVQIDSCVLDWDNKYSELNSTKVEECNA